MKDKKKVLRIVASAIAVLEIIAATVFVCYLWKLNILTSMQMILVGGIAAAISLILLVIAVLKKVGVAARVVGMILSVVLLVVFGVGSVCLGKMVGFLENMTSNVGYETQTYVVAVKRDSEFREIAGLSGKEIGLQQINPHYDLVVEKLSEVVDFEAKQYSDLTKMAEDVKKAKIPALVTTESYFESLAEESDTDEYLRILYTFEIRYEKDMADAETVDVVSKPFILYISGSDDRSDTLSDASRSDVNMLAVVNPEKHKILLVSIPRDYYVQLHGTTGTKDKLTHAGVFGIEMSRATVEDFLDIDIAHTVKLGFKALVDVVDAVDGIDIDSDHAFTARANKGCKFSVGVQHVDGACALAFVRERKTYGLGDLHRIQNQQTVLTALIEKASQPKYLVKYADILDATSAALKTSLSYGELTSLVREQIATMASWEIESISINGFGSMQPTYSMGSQLLFVMLPDNDSIAVAKAKIVEYLSEDE